MSFAALLDPAWDNVILLSTQECRKIENFGETHHCNLWDKIAESW